MACNCSGKKIKDKNVKEQTYTLPKNVYECPYCGALRTDDEMVAIRICDCCARKVDKFIKKRKDVVKKNKPIRY